MMLAVLGGVVGFALGMGAGFVAGKWARAMHSAVYWGLNAIVVVLGIIGNAYGLISEWTWLVIGSLAFMGGGITGLKYGYAHVVGQWRRAEDAPEGDPEGEG